MNHCRCLVAAVSLACVIAGGGQYVVSAQEGWASLTIHRRICPLDVFSDLYRRCHEQPHPYRVTVSLGGAETRRAQTDPAGNVVFDGLTPGAYFTGDSAPGGDFTYRHIFCSAAETPGVPRPGGLGAIILAAGDAVVCDWYIMNPDLSGTSIPTPAPTPTPRPPLPDGTTLTIASWLCPEDYVDSDYAATCRTRPGADFRYSTGHVGYRNAPAAGADGLVTFDLGGRQPGRVVVAVRPGEGLDGYYAAVVDCSAGGTPLHASPLDTLATFHMVAVPAAPGEDVFCDWYNVPYGSS